MVSTFVKSNCSDLEVVESLIPTSVCTVYFLSRTYGVITYLSMFVISIAIRMGEEKFSIT